MALHAKDGSSVADEVFGSKRLMADAPIYNFPTEEVAPDRAYQIVHDEVILDGNARLNLATFCQTFEEEQVHKLMDEAISKNMIDKDEYPQTAELEMRCVHMLADLWNSPEAKTTMGCSTTGSSEAAMLGGLAMKWRWRDKMRKLGKSTDRPNLVTGPVQICWHKFARYWDIELRVIPMDSDSFHATAEKVVQYCDENTIGVVSTLGTTYTLHYEPIEEISKALDKLQEEKSWDIPIHVDGASGAFLAPFTAPDLLWDFRLSRVKSINASGHKFGLAPLGCGWVLWRDKEDLPEDLIFNVNYLGGNMPTFALNFSRPAGQIIAQYYNFLRLGREGYRKIQSACYETAEFMASELTKLGIFEIISCGSNCIPGVCWRLKSDAKVGFNLYDLADRLRYRGWLLPAYSLPENLQEMVIQRILVRHGVSHDLVSLLIKDIKDAISFFENHPISNSMTEEEASSFKH